MTMTMEGISSINKRENKKYNKHNHFEDIPLQQQNDNIPS